MCVYWILNDDLNMVKVGVSTNPKSRLSQLQTGNSSKLTLVGVSDEVDEKALHELYSPFRVNMEWFEWNALIKCHCESLRNSRHLHLELNENMGVNVTYTDLTPNLRSQMLHIALQEVEESMEDVRLEHVAEIERLKKELEADPPPNNATYYEGESDPQECLRNLIRQHTNDSRGANEKDVRLNATGRGMSITEYEKTLDALLDSGTLYEPAIGQIALLDAPTITLSNVKNTND